MNFVKNKDFGKGTQSVKVALKGFLLLIVISFPD